MGCREAHQSPIADVIPGSIRNALNWRNNLCPPTLRQNGANQHECKAISRILQYGIRQNRLPWGEPGAARNSGLKEEQDIPLYKNWRERKSAFPAKFSSKQGLEKEKACLSIVSGISS